MKTKCLIFILLIVTCIAFFYPNNNVSAEEKLKEIDIATSPHNLLFNTSNLKPGDSVSKTLVVINEGKNDFYYLFSNQFLKGSEYFYNNIFLTVRDDKEVLFNDKIINFKKIESRFLRKGTSENLYFQLNIPNELGNEFQGLGSEFQFKFYVEGTLGGVLPADGPKLPDTGSDMFNILVVGAVLVLTGSTFQFIVKRRSKLRKEV
jgi:LPXTG-motif cell wall-anchored protein